ncbi:MAG: class I SAM-dependent methyltransferase [Thermomicrobiales bacterium]
MPEGWLWDETLYLGSAPYYVQGRLPYAPDLADRLADALHLDGQGRLIDVGCGPGVLTLTLAHLFEEVIGVDPDAGMLIEAQHRGAVAGITNIQWMRFRAEELPAELGTFRVATFGQSFHWMERDLVATTMRSMLEAGGAFVQIADAKDAQPITEADLPFAPPPFAAIRELVKHYLGPDQRAGRGTLQFGTPGDEADVLKRAGFHPPQRLRVPDSRIVERSSDDLVAWVYSLSSSAPHHFEADLTAFETDLRQLLDEVSSTGRFSERIPDTEVFIWRKPRES